MPEVIDTAKKAVSTVDLALSAIGILKTGAVIFVMMMLEWSKLRERKAELATAKAENDLEVEKVKAAIQAVAGDTSAKANVADYLAKHPLPLGPGKGPGSPDEGGD